VGGEEFNDAGEDTDNAVIQKDLDADLPVAELPPPMRGRGYWQVRLAAGRRAPTG
jgi:hypothetical protein